MAKAKRSTMDIFALLAKAKARVKKDKEDREKSLKKKVAPPEKKKPVITEFSDTEDWVLSMILVAVMHANPEASAEEATKIAKDWVRRLHQPRSGAIWRRQVDRISRTGIRAAASKIRRELYKII